MSSRSVFNCRHCGYQSAKWLGRCPSCSAWEAFEEAADRNVRATIRASRVVSFPEIETIEMCRLLTGIGEFDRVLGGGLVPGGVVLLGGEPGIGKSTLLLQATAGLAASGSRVLYVSGEESAAQIRLRGERLGAISPAVLVAAECDVDSSIEAARRAAPALLVVDSIQSLRCGEVGAVPGSVGQVRAAAARFVEYAKSSATPVVLVGHVTKDGQLAGPRVLEHLVDAVIQFEGDRHHAHRILRATKNRFGPTDELGVFRMAEAGLVEVANPSELFLAERPDTPPPGSAVLPAIEGSRTLLVEIQALIGEPMQGSPRRTALGIESNRLAMVLAVLHRRMGIALADRDVFVSVAGGVVVTEPAADLATALAIASAVRGRPIPPASVAFGEIGLTGEVRAVSRADSRLREAARLGFTRCWAPAGTASSPVPGLEIVRLSNVEQAVAALTNTAAERRQIG